jgi:hypothetical protein
MSDELEICLAALFLNRGKDVLTANEFTMYVSLDLRWMQVKDADTLMRILLEKKLMSRTGEYLRPLIDTAEVNVPVAYRPSEALLRSLREDGSKRPAAEKGDVPAPLPILIQKALDSGVEKGAFVSECNRISKKADVDMEVAALMILREKGVDVTPFIGDVRSSVLGR